jgi:mannose-6-phosphate isomerase-like protein (cupin superfamily)
MKVGFGLLVLALVLIGVSFSLLRAQSSGASNPAGRMIASETRPVGTGIDALELAGPIDLTLRYGPAASLEVRGEQRLLGNVESTQQGGVLHIGTRGIVLRHNRPLQAILVLPTLASLTVDGSGDSTVDGFSGERIDVSLDGSGSVKFNGRFRQVHAGLHGSGDLEVMGGSSDTVEAEVVGSGNMTLAGSCKEFKARSTGSGELDAQHLRAETVAVRQLGSGSSTVFARGAVSASVSGSGDVDVHGNPETRSVSRTGSGDVSFSD